MTTRKEINQFIDKMYLTRHREQLKSFCETHKNWDPIKMIFEEKDIK